MGVRFVIGACFNTNFFRLALNPLSCTAYKNVQSVQQRAHIKIDVDGSGPLDPFPVTCEFYCKFYFKYYLFQFDGLSIYFAHICSKSVHYLFMWK